MAFSFDEIFVTNLLSTALGSLSVCCVSDKVKDIISGQLRDIERALTFCCGDDDE